LVELRGIQAGKGFRVNLPLTKGANSDGIDVLWARRKIEDLMDSLHEGGDKDQVRADVTKVALAHHLVSRYTSLVAVDRTPTRPAKKSLASRPVPTNLPSGMEYGAVFGQTAPFPQTATPAPLWLLAGLFLLLAGGGLLFLPSRGRE
jgi:Ca-activated chloride channel family protein